MTPRATVTVLVVGVALSIACALITGRLIPGHDWVTSTTFETPDRVPLPRKAAALNLSEGRFSIEGTVVERRTGLPVARVPIEVITEDRQPGSWSVETDDQGRWAVRGLPAGRYFAMARAPGYAFVTSGWPRYGLSEKRPNKTIEFQVFRGNSISGRVLDQTGEPVPIAELVLLWMPPGTTSPITWTVGAQARADGTFTFGDLDDGEYVVGAKAPLATLTYYRGARDARQATRLLVSDGAAIDGVEFSLIPEPRGNRPAADAPDRQRRTSILKGTVTDPAAVAVMVLQRGRDGTVLCAGSGALREDEFEIPPLPAGRYRAVVTRPCCKGEPPTPLETLWNRGTPVTLRDNETLTIDLSLR